MTSPTPRLPRPDPADGSMVGFSKPRAVCHRAVGTGNHDRAHRGSDNEFHDPSVDWALVWAKFIRSPKSGLFLIALICCVQLESEYSRRVDSIIKRISNLLISSAESRGGG